MSQGNHQTSFLLGATVQLLPPYVVYVQGRHVGQQERPVGCTKPTKFRAKTFGGTPVQQALFSSRGSWSRSFLNSSYDPSLAGKCVGAISLQKKENSGSKSCSFLGLLRDSEWGNRRLMSCALVKSCLAMSLRTPGTQRSGLQIRIGRCHSRGHGTLGN